MARIARVVAELSIEKPNTNKLTEFKMLGFSTQQTIDPSNNTPILPPPNSEKPSLIPKNHKNLAQCQLCTINTKTDIRIY